MRIEFEKYQGTGNDFIIIDDRNQTFPQNVELVKSLCHRKFGIGSDGILLIQRSSRADFEAVFFNPDGSRSLCGNGTRCAIMFAEKLGLGKKIGVLNTTDGLHEYVIRGENTVALQMRDVAEVESVLKEIFIHTGSPHLIIPVNDVKDVDVVKEGQKRRYRKEFEEMGGTNVNFVSPGNEDGVYHVRTYERGVEAETLSCGTGVTAVALAMAHNGYNGNEIKLITAGGRLIVRFQRAGSGFNEIWLEGPAYQVYSGVINA